MHWFPRRILDLRLRVSTANEKIGIDKSEMGERAYDYVFLKTELQPEEFGYSRPIENGAIPPQTSTADSILYGRSTLQG